MDLLYLVTFIVAFISSILSGMSGGGGGFVMAPYWLVLGLSPAQGAAAGTFMAIGMSSSSVAAFRKSGYLGTNRRVLVILLVAAFVASITGAFALPRIEIEAYRLGLGVVTLAAIPLLFWRPDVRIRSRKFRLFGVMLAVTLLFAGSLIASSLFSLLFTLTLLGFSGMSFMEVTAQRRVVGVMQSSVMFGLLFIQGYFMVQHAIAGFIGGSIGSYIGTKLAIRQGEMFARYALVGMIAASSLALLI